MFCVRINKHKKKKTVNDFYSIDHIMLLISNYIESINYFEILRTIFCNNNIHLTK